MSTEHSVSRKYSIYTLFNQNLPQSKVIWGEKKRRNFCCRHKLRDKNKKELYFAVSERVLKITGNST